MHGLFVPKPLKRQRGFDQGAGFSAGRANVSVSFAAAMVQHFMLRETTEFPVQPRRTTETANIPNT
jgi:hypothetical protein